MPHIYFHISFTPISWAQSFLNWPHTKMAAAQNFVLIPHTFLMPAYYCNDHAHFNSHFAHLLNDRADLYQVPAHFLLGDAFSARTFVTRQSSRAERRSFNLVNHRLSRLRAPTFPKSSISMHLCTKECQIFSLVLVA